MALPRVSPNTSTTDIFISLEQEAAVKKFEKAKRIWGQSKELISGEEYENQVEVIANSIAQKYPNQPLILMQVLEGGAYMAHRLAAAFKKLGVGYERTSISTSSYLNGTTAAKEVKLIPLNKMSFAGRIIVIAEDIIDTAGTYVKIKEWLDSQNPAQVEFVAGINKPHKRSPENKGIHPSYAVLTTDDPGFCAGGGMDFFGYYRDEESVRTADPALFEPTPPSSPRKTR